MRRITALHGFLGSPKDFKALGLEAISAPNLFHVPIGPMTLWARRLNRFIPDQHVLLGYSMGGRLALHCILEQPKKYEAAIIMAAHPGLKSARLRIERIERDRLWANKFSTMPWPDLMAEWNHLPALRSSTIIPRHEEDFSRAELCRSLKYFSLGQQEYLIPAINALEMPLLWLAPEQEASHVSGLDFRNDLSRLEIVSKGSHRFMFENPKLVQSIINDFMRSLGRAPW